MKIKKIHIISVICLFTIINIIPVNSSQINIKNDIYLKENNPKLYDNFLDIAIANTYEKSITILYNNGSGGFLVRHDIKTNGMPYYLLNEDFNLDGIKDLAVTLKSNNEVGILIQNDTTEFQKFDTYLVGSSPSKIVSGFFNSDEYLDLAILNQDSSVSLLMNNKNGSFTEAIDLGVNYPLGLAAGDFNGDGFDDLAVTDPADNPWTDDVQLYINKKNNKAEFDHVLYDNIGQQIYGITSADFNNDGLTDLAFRDIGGLGGILVPLANLSCSELFERPQRNHPQVCNINGLITDDFDKDGFMDIAVANIYSHPAAAKLNSVNILFGQGNGTFEDYLSYSYGSEKYPHYLTSGDINNDGFVDIVFCNPEKITNKAVIPATINVLLGAENKTFVRVGEDIFLGKDLAGVTIGDFGVPENKNPYDCDFICPEYGEYNRDISFNFNCYEPDEDQVFFEIDWGDGSAIEKTELCYGSINVNHKWRQRGEFTIRARAVDYNGGETKSTIHKIWIRKTFHDKNIWLENIFSNLQLLINLLKK